MNVRRILPLAALFFFFFFTGDQIHSQVSSDGSALRAAVESDSLPDSPLPVYVGSVSQALPPSGAYPLPAVYLAAYSSVRLTFGSYDGRPNPDLSQIAGASNSRIGPGIWYPHRIYSPVVEGFKFGHQRMSDIFGGFATNVKHVLHLGSSSSNR